MDSAGNVTCRNSLNVLPVLSVLPDCEYYTCEM